MSPQVTPSERPELLGLEPEAAAEALKRFMDDRGESPYRARQVLAWMYERRAPAFAEMSPLPRSLRTALDAAFSLSPLTAGFTARSSDGTLKHLWELTDKEQVESVLIPTSGRVTLCLSSQVGCALACRFCATGDFGFRRHLRASEIVAQFRDADRVAHAAFGTGVANVVYMGMGEPLANLDSVLTSLAVLHRGFGVGARRITVSTVGLIPGIQRLTERPEPFRLALSLHAPNHALRSELVPVEKRYPLTDLFVALRAYQAKKKRRITFEYAMISGVNDDEKLAEEVADLATGLRVFVNLIPFNPIPSRNWRPSPARQIERFRAALEARSIPVAVRQPRGRDIAAACGQLRLERDLAKSVGLLTGLSAG